LGKPLKSILHCEEDIPIYAATITDNGVAASAEVADGFFPVWMDPEQYSVFQGPIEKGFAKAGEKDLTQFEIAPFVTVVMGDDLDQCMMPVRGHDGALHWWHGCSRIRTSTMTIASVWAIPRRSSEDSGSVSWRAKKTKPWRLCQKELIDACALVGPAERIRERLARWKTAGNNGHVSSMLLGCQDPMALQVVAEEML